VFPVRPSGAAPEGLGAARFFNTPASRIAEARALPTRRVWALVQLRPQIHHPGQRASGSHRLPNTLSNMGHRSPHLRVLGAHFHHFQGHIPQAGRAARARESHTDLAVASCFGPRSCQFSCFGPRSCFIIFALDIPFNVQ
jgi:hypothetical protein